MQFIAAPDMSFADEDLRHGAPAMRFRHHAPALFHIVTDVDLGEFHILPAQQSLGRKTIRAKSRRIDGDLGHGVTTRDNNDALNMELLRLGHKREGQDVNMGSPRRLERPGAGFERRSGSADVIDEDQGFPRHRCAALLGHDEGVPDIAPPLFMIEPGLGSCRAQPAQKFGPKGLVCIPADLAGKERRLVVAPPPEPPAIKRDRDDRIGGFEDIGPCPDHQTRHQETRFMPVVIFQGMDQNSCRVIEEER